MPQDFAGAFAQLREILKRSADGMVVLSDQPTEFTVTTRAIGPNKKPIWFAGVMLKKSAVTYHLLPLYFNPKLEALIPPELRPRKQGKACFNFQRPDADLFAKLDALTRQARECWVQNGFLEPGPIPPERFAAALRAGGQDPAALAKLRKNNGKQAAAKRAETMRKKARKRTQAAKKK